MTKQLKSQAATIMFWKNTNPQIQRYNQIAPSWSYFDKKAESAAYNKYNELSNFLNLYKYV